MSTLHLESRTLGGVLDPTPSVAIISINNLEVDPPAHGKCRFTRCGIISNGFQYTFCETGLDVVMVTQQVTKDFIARQIEKLSQDELVEVVQFREQGPIQRAGSQELVEKELTFYPPQVASTPVSARRWRCRITSSSLP
jgi:hypothetical protein